MCVTCGCSDNSQVTVTSLDNGKTSHTHTLADGTVITHTHAHDQENGTISHSHTHIHQHDHSHLETSAIHARMHGTTVNLEQEILNKNDRIAEQNRNWFQERGILALNLVSSPGAGKTTLLTRTINDFKSQLTISVIEGDQETVNDAEKIRQTGCQVVQINTGVGCHLEAAMVQRGYLELNPPSNSIDSNFLSFCHYWFWFK